MQGGRQQDKPTVGRSGTACRALSSLGAAILGYAGVDYSMNADAYSYLLEKKPPVLQRVREILARQP